MEQIDRFLASREETCATSTMATYTAYLCAYRCWLASQSPCTPPFAPETIREYLAVLRDRHLSAATLDNRFRLLKTCCRWLVDEGLLDRDPFVGRGRVRPLAHKRAHRRVYSDTEVIALLAATRQMEAPRRRDRRAVDGLARREPLQVRALILLLVDSALRIGEAAALVCGQVRREPLQVRSKGGHWDAAFVTPATRQVLLGLAGDRADDAPLFRDRTGGPCTTRSLRGSVQRLAQRAGVDLPPRPLHAFRHYAARQWLKAGLEDLTIRQLMRHEQLSTTQIYTVLSPEELAALHAEASPVVRLMQQAAIG